MLRRIGQLGLFSAWFAVACAGSSNHHDGDGDGSGGSSSTGGKGIALDDLPAKYAAALCTAYENCLGEALTVFTNGEDCSTRTEGQLVDGFQVIEDAVDAGTAEYHGDKAQACLDELAAKDCAALMERESDACEATLTGTIELGGDCSSNVDCEGTAYCKSDGTCPGQCTALETAGGECEASDQCASGLNCSADRRCVKPAGPGELCQGGEPECAAGYFCAGAQEDQNVPGHCTTYDEFFASDSSCDILAGELCASPLVCEIEGFSEAGIESSCQPHVGSGADCKLAFPDECPEGEFCSTPTDSLDGTCTQRPAAGEPCGFGVGGDQSICEAYARCDNGVCRPLANLGESCASDAVCYSGYCNEETCTANNACQ